MFYKTETSGEWHTANKIYFPDGTVFDNKTTKQKDGWYWRDSEPEEYTIWKKEKDEELIKNRLSWQEQF